MANPFRAIFSAEPFHEGEDPDAAPSRYCGLDGARRWSFRRYIQNLGWMYPFGLLFMIFTVGEIRSGDPGQLVLAVRIAVLVMIGLVYVTTPWIADTGLRTRWCWVGLFIALTLGTIGYQGWEFASFGVYVSVMLATLIPWVQARWAVLGWNAVVAFCAIPSWSLPLLIVAMMGLVVGWSAGAGIESGRVRRHLHQAEQRMSVLAVQAERERIARDLHDILGHSLTAISIKSGLAARLAEADVAAAREQMTEVEQIARVALADVRATTTGLRQVRLASEVAGARSVLMAAGVAPHVPTAMPALSEADSELLGYVVREAVTNVVRHAEATRCTIIVEDRTVTITDDGVGIAGTPQTGSGLAGLRERLKRAGATLVVEPARPTGTRVRAELPNSRPTANEVARQGSRSDGRPAGRTASTPAGVAGIS